VHDDLPAMDDDPVRRGRPSNHVAFGEATAILAGDGLLTEAFAVMAREGLRLGLAPEVVSRAVLELALAAGAEGMVGGQMADILAEGTNAGIEQVLSIHRRKTGALLRGAVRIGAIVGGASEGELDALTVFGERVGLAFQVADDLLDEIGATAATGKAAQRDRERGKSTVATALGIEPARRRLAGLLDEALGAVAAFGDDAEPLRRIASGVLRRAL
jgi:geranylgeranyl diphosphate synthase, type II